MQNNTFKTTDFHTAAVLNALGFKVQNIITFNERKTFVFKDTKELQDALGRFWERKLLIDAQALLQSIKNLKTRIYS